MKRRLVKYSFYTLVALVLMYVYTAVGIRNYSKEFFNSKSDVAIVLGAGTAAGNLSPIFKERANHAIELIKLDSIQYIVFTGGVGEGQNISDSRAALNYAVEKGVDSAKVLIEETSCITYFNIKNAKSLMNQKGLSTSLIVSDPYHMKRAMHMCNKMGLNAKPSPTQTSMYRSAKTKFNFLFKETYNYWAYIIIGQHRPIE